MSAATMTMPQTQNGMVIQHLESTDPQTGEPRTISPLEAFALYRIFRLSARVYDINKRFEADGDSRRIVAELKYDPNGKRYARYSLEEDAGE